MRRFFLWCRLLTKRNLRRKGYLAVLLSAPLLALLLSLAAKQGGGLVTVALYREDGEDLTAQAAAGQKTFRLPDAPDDGRFLVPAGHDDGNVSGTDAFPVFLPILCGNVKVSFHPWIPPIRLPLPGSALPPAGWPAAPGR